MKIRSRLLPFAFLPMILPAVTSAQEFTARDAFWSASDLITVAPNPAAHKAADTHTHPRQNTKTEISGAPNTNRSAKPPRDNTEIAQLVAANGYGAAPKLLRMAENRLGLRCSIMLRNAKNEYTEVAPGTVFHSGDHIRLSLLANTPGYLYVIQQGSTGAWKPIFPPAAAAADENKVPAGQPQVVPGGTHAFLFDQNAGDEKLYVILSRTSIADIDRVIRNLSNGKTDQPQQPADNADAGTMVEAKNNIPDIFVKQLASRDLSLVDEEKVDQSSDPSIQGEKAIYVVSKASKSESNSQVMLKLDLRHE